MKKIPVDKQLYKLYKQIDILTERQRAIRKQFMYLNECKKAARLGNYKGAPIALRTLYEKQLTRIAEETLHEYLKIARKLMKLVRKVNSLIIFADVSNDPHAEY